MAFSQTTMSSAPTTQSAALRRIKQQVYVDIPSSPIPLSRYSAMSKSNATSHVHAASVAMSGVLKENTPLALTQGNMITPSTSRKRKLSERDVPSSTLGLLANTKKQKLIKPPVVALPSIPAPPVASNVSLEYPNGYMYCHQCSRKYDVAECIQCTMKLSHTSKDGTLKERRCSGRFCGRCLKSRYGEDIVEAKSTDKRKQEHGHVESSYTFRCPKCRGICNCRSCRRAQGLEPTGKFKQLAPKAGAVPAAQVLIADPKAASKKTSPQAEQKIKAKAVSTSTPHNSVTVRKDSVVAQEPPAKKAKPLKPLPPIIWTSVATNLNLEEAEMRFQIREFTLRFACVMEPTISRTHLGELDGIRSSTRGSEDMTGWVSETCVRSLLLGTLYLLVDIDKGSIEKSIRTTIKDIRASGANLNKMWQALLSLRESLDSDAGSTSSSEPDSVLSFPDPLPPPASAVIHNTRNTRNSGATSVQVSNSAQMVPVLNALVEAAFNTDLVREELENGVKEGKEIAREVRDRMKKENDEWDIERKRIEELTKENITEESANGKPKGSSKEMKLKREAHKERLHRLESALKVVLPGFAPRFAPLGHDTGGRIFYALSPGIVERKAALNFLASETRPKNRNHGKKKERMWGEEEKSGMKEWSWFVGVWGKKPSNETNLSDVGRAVKHVIKRQGNGDSSDTDEEDEDEDAKKWWGFYEPRAVQHVAEWVAASTGSGGETLSASPSSSLVKGLKEYGALLEWRVREDKYEGMDVSEE